MDLALNNLQRLICHKTQTTNQLLTHMIWFGWLLWHINHCRLFNAIYKYILDMICKHFVDNIIHRD